MEFRAYFKHMDSSLPLYAYADKKITNCIEKYVRAPIEAHVTFSVDRGINHIACDVMAGGGFTLRVEADDPTSMYSAVDRLEDRLNGRLRRQKERITSHKSRVASAPAKPDEAAGLAADASGPDQQPVDASYVLNYEKVWHENRPADHF